MLIRTSQMLGLGAIVISTLLNIAHAQSIETMAAVQNRTFDRTHEITIRGGAVPDDLYNISYPVSLAYTFNFNEWLAWEPLRATLFLNSPRDLKRSLIDDYGVAPSDFDYPIYAFHTSAVIKPTYGKDSWFNKKVVHHQTYLTLGGGIAGYEKEYNYGEPTQELAWSARASIGRKYFINPMIALNFEAEELIAFKADGMQNNLVISAGVDIRFNLSMPGSQSKELDTLYKFLENN